MIFSCIFRLQVERACEAASGAMNGYPFSSPFPFEDTRKSCKDDILLTVGFNLRKASYPLTTALQGRHLIVSSLRDFGIVLSVGRKLKHTVNNVFPLRGSLPDSCKILVIAKPQAEAIQPTIHSGLLRYARNDEETDRILPDSIYAKNDLNSNRGGLKSMFFSSLRSRRLKQSGLHYPPDCFAASRLAMTKTSQNQCPVKDIMLVEKRNQHQPPSRKDGMLVEKNHRIPYLRHGEDISRHIFSTNIMSLRDVEADAHIYRYPPDCFAASRLTMTKTQEQCRRHYSLVDNLRISKPSCRMYDDNNNACRDAARHVSTNDVSGKSCKDDIYSIHLIKLVKSQTGRRFTGCRSVARRPNAPHATAFLNLGQEQTPPLWDFGMTKQNLFFSSHCKDEDRSNPIINFHDYIYRIASLRPQ